MVSVSLSFSGTEQPPRYPRSDLRAASSRPHPAHGSLVEEESHTGLTGHLLWLVSAAHPPGPMAQEPREPCSSTLPIPAGETCCAQGPFSPSFHTRVRIPGFFPKPVTSLALWSFSLPWEHEGWYPRFHPQPLCPHSLPQVSPGSSGSLDPRSNIPAISGAWDTSAAAWLAPDRGFHSPVLCSALRRPPAPAFFSLHLTVSSRF